VQLDLMKSTLKAPGTNLLTLECNEPLSTFAFKFNWRRFIAGECYLDAEDSIKSVSRMEAKAGACYAVLRPGLSSDGTR